MRGSARFPEKLREQLRGRGHDPLCRVHSPARRADERSLKMDPQDFRGEFAGRILAGIEDKVGDARNAVARFLFAGRYSRGHQGSRAVRRDRHCNEFERLAGALHHVVATGSVNVDVDKARHDGFSVRGDFTRAARQVDFPPPAYGSYLAALHDHQGIGNFFEWSECPVGVDDNRLHMDGIILLESRRNWEIRCTRVFQNQPSCRFAGRPSNLYPGTGFLSLDGSRCYTLRHHRAYPTR